MTLSAPPGCKKSAPGPHAAVHDRGIGGGLCKKTASELTKIAVTYGFNGKFTKLGIARAGKITVLKEDAPDYQGVLGFDSGKSRESQDGNLDLDDGATPTSATPCIHLGLECFQH
jgi:hypothetical protein